MAAHLEDGLAAGRRAERPLPRGLIDPRVVRLELLRLRSAAGAWDASERALRSDDSFLVDGLERPG